MMLFDINEKYICNVYSAILSPFAARDKLYIIIIINTLYNKSDFNQ